MEAEIKILHQDIEKLRRDVDLLKRLLFSEGKLTPWAKKQLELARAQKEEDYLSLEQI